MIRLNAQESLNDATPAVEPPARAIPTAHTAQSPDDRDPPGRDAAPRTRYPHAEHATIHRVAMRLVWPVTAAICAALAVVATSQLRYRATAQFRVNGSMDEARGKLLDFLWLRADQDQFSAWNVLTAPDDATMKAEITVTDPDTANVVIRSLADGFKKNLANTATHATHKPDNTERVLAEIIDEGHADIEALRKELSRLERAIPAHDPADDDAEARARIAELIDDYEFHRDNEIDATARIDRLGTTPTDPRIDPETRQKRYAARESLQQDIDELTVQLTLGRRQLDHVWQNASPTLDGLISAIATLVRQSSGDAAREADATHRAIVAEFSRPAELYQKRLGTFSSNWSQTFVRLRSQPADPHAPRLFATQVKLHDLLADFSFRAGKLVDTMRSRLQSLTQQANGAAHHALVSQMRRIFHRFEADHRQFEFLAADVYRRSNFRLDAAIKSARGLRRRVHTTVDAIDTQLLAEATATASRLRKTEIREADRQLRETRERCRQTIDELLETLAARDGALKQTSIRTRNVCAFEQVQQRHADTTEQLQRRKTLLSDHLRAAQAEATTPLSVDIIKCGADESPQGLARELTYALVAGALAFTAVTFVNRR